jgi:hypothetical protein
MAGKAAAELLLEQIRSQNAATIEAVESMRQAIVRRLEGSEQECRDRDSLLELAVRDLIEALARLDERLAALERRRA